MEKESAGGKKAHHDEQPKEPLFNNFQLCQNFLGLPLGNGRMGRFCLG